MAEKKPTSTREPFKFQEIASFNEQPIPAPPPALEKLFEERPAPAPRPVEPPPAPIKPIKKGGRPKGPDKVKKSVYLAYDLTRLEKLRFNTAVHGGVMTKDDGEIIDAALEVLDYLSSRPELGYLIKQARDNKP